MANKQNIFYFIRFPQNYNSYPDAERAARDLPYSSLEISYHKPQPQYKSWVPNWLIRLITK